jgi:hypothetical protein
VLKEILVMVAMIDLYHLFLFPFLVQVLNLLFHHYFHCFGFLDFHLGFLDS